MIVENQLPLRAAASAIYSCAQSILAASDAKRLRTKFLPGGEVELGNLLIFSEKQYYKLISRGFGVPRLMNLFLSPVQSIRLILSLAKVGKLYKSKDLKAAAPIQLKASLEAICTYLNHNSYSSKIFKVEERFCLLIGISNTETNFLIYYENQGGWKVYLAENQQPESASLLFKDIKIAQDAAVGRLNSWLSLTNGNILVAGRIPLIDKFGYVARLVQKEVPLPR
jgi:hypothetical protein